MKYIRKFTIQAAHFNDDAQYRAYVDAVKMHDEGHNESCASLLFRALQGIHGHNFDITVTAHGDLAAGADWLISDIELERLVREWDNTNLSVHHDFLEPGKRATTENMAQLLANKIIKKLGRGLSKLHVRVQETNGIAAEYECS